MEKYVHMSFAYAVCSWVCLHCCERQATRGEIVKWRERERELVLRKLREYVGSFQVNKSKHILSIKFPPSARQSLLPQTEGKQKEKERKSNSIRWKTHNSCPERSSFLSAQQASCSRLDRWKSSWDRIVVWTATIDDFRWRLPSCAHIDRRLEVHLWAIELEAADVLWRCENNVLKHWNEKM